MPAVSAGVRRGDVGPDRSQPSASAVVRLRSVVEPELGLRRAPRRGEGGRGAREPERREHGARPGGVHDDGDHAATAAARAREHVGGEHPAQQLGPREPGRTRGAARRRGGGWWLATARGHQRAVVRAGLAGGAEHPRVANEMTTGWGG